MRIKKIKVENFKSFNDLEVELNDFNLLIGANAAGKSNFIHIFEFLRDIAKFSLKDAISMQGDLEYLRNVNIGADRNFSVEICSDYDESIRIVGPPGSDLMSGLKITEVIYRFAIEFYKSRPGFKIIEDKLSFGFEVLNIKKKSAEEKIADGVLTLESIKGNIKTKLETTPSIELDVADIFPSRLFFERMPPKTLLLETPYLKLPFDVADIFSGVSVYNIDPKLPKKAIPLTGKTELEEDGSNLALVLKNILDDKNNKRSLVNLIKDVLTFVDDLDVEKFSDRSLIVRLKEIYSKNKFLYAPLLSDGTLNITALIIALYFSKKPFIIIEEPERNIHPHLISKVLEMMREVSKKKQIIVTTHNPEILKHSRLQDILFISRDKEGFSGISRPAENEQVKIFLENEMGIDELFLENLLEL